MLSTVVAGVISYIASEQQPRVYQSTTTLMVGQVIQKANPTDADFYTTQQLAESYAQIAVRQPVLQAVVDSLELDIPWPALKWQINVSSIPQTQLLGITVQDISPERAAAIADEIAYQLILKSPNSPESKARQERSQFVQQELDDIETKMQSAKAQKKQLEAELEKAFSARQISDLQSQINTLDSLISTWQGNYTDLLGFLEGGGSPNFLTVIEPAQLPTEPVSPKVEVNVVLAAMAGLILALGAALLLEFIDDTVKSTDDLISSLGLTALGGIKRIKGGSDYRNVLVIHQNPFAPLAEAYRGIRTNIQFKSLDQPAKSLLITSATPAEGKSITTANLAVTTARAFLKTIIVDADLRRPTLHKIFDVPNKDGVTDFIVSPELDVNDFLKETGVENLRILTCGPLPPNPAEMLGSKRMADLLARLRELADVIIVDSPPVMPVTDAAVLSNQVDGVIMVVQAKRTRREIARRAIKRLDQVGANILGAVLNQIPGRAEYSETYSAYTQSDRQAFIGIENSSSNRLWQLVKGINQNNKDYPVKKPRLKPGVSGENEI